MRAKLIFIFIICFNIYIGFNILTDFGRAFADPRLEKLIHEFSGWKNHSMKFDDPRSPIFPYRHLRFEDGLTQKARAEVFRLQEAGDCNGRLQDHAVEGFFGLYPFLVPALFRYPLGEKLSSSIRWYNSELLSRCYYFAGLNELGGWFDIRRLEPLDGSWLTHLAINDNRDLDMTFVREQWWEISNGLGILAFCRSYPPSIRDVLKVAHQMGGLTFTSQEAVYIMSRARLHGVITQDEVEAAFKRLQVDGVLKHDINRLFSKAQSHLLHEMPPVRGNWQALCASRFRPKKSL